MFSINYDAPDRVAFIDHVQLVNKCECSDIL